MIVQQAMRELLTELLLISYSMTGTMAGVEAATATVFDSSTAAKKSSEGGSPRKQSLVDFGSG